MNKRFAKPQVLVLGGNFAGLGAAQKIRDYAGDACDITVIDRKGYLDFIPNIPLEVFEGRDPAVTMHMNLVEVLAKDDIAFKQAEITGIDIAARTVRMRPSERPGAPEYTMRYDYVVIALGARLAYDDIEGFAEYGHTISDAFHANRMIDYLKHDYQGGPIVVGSDRFEQGQKGRPDWLPTALAACEGPPVEVSLSLAHWLEENGKGGAKDITIFTPAELIAEDAGEKVVGQLLDAAGAMGFGYVNKVEGIKRLTKDTIEFTDGRSLPAEMKVIFPNWKPHDFLKGLPVSDEVGFIITDMRMRNPDHPEVFACGDAAAITVPKLGAIGHQECDVVGRQIAGDLGKLSSAEANKEWHPEVVCIGDMGGGKAFYIHANSWFGGDIQELRMGKIPYMQKVAYKELFFRNHGRVPGWGVPLAEWSAENLIRA
ncbi:pyridine nucleotide-disulfide oxidoreductase [Thioclava marina]|uniref:Pyridine nucleotide-disulfide oxidoreductase n=1 Tax=Thioclava marina TaxID=1915077 RepID=A0ABX3MLZ7_9RHOB|nr:FAD-dependent oxidoreductase [Thioclava marina]OOY12536.1 pyridine nucleotide-disulfide oxidoreductase [Thioclava marina]